MTWKEICEDPYLSKWPFRVESDRWGNAVLSPPPGYPHSGYQGEIVFQLRSLLPKGRALGECPIKTSEGVKAPDAAWASRKWLRQQPAISRLCLVAPEICVEVLSPSNSKREVVEKFQLYFEKGAQECWLCDKDGNITFHTAQEQIARSELCPKFPPKISLDI